MKKSCFWNVVKHDFKSLGFWIGLTILCILMCVLAIKYQDLGQGICKNIGSLLIVPIPFIFGNINLGAIIYFGLVIAVAIYLCYKIWSLTDINSYATKIDCYIGLCFDLIFGFLSLVLLLSTVTDNIENYSGFIMLIFMYIIIGIVAGYLYMHIQNAGID